MVIDGLEISNQISALSGFSTTTLSFATPTR